ncbi:alpha/beta hydrolase fold domain-containing protein [Microbacterium chocolatum]|uniref:alpha/beta hydrolase n=1 Tax=Microbacterium aurantiacum TaxID=162393 RepID=UPI00338E9FE6
MPTPPPFDPEVGYALATRDDVVTGLADDEIPALRTRSIRPDAEALSLDGELEVRVLRADLTGRESVEIVLLRPTEAAAPVPVLYHVHGGGLVVGTPYDDLPAVARWASAAGFAVAAVDYRLAPEHPYPAAVEDVYTGLVWLAGEAPSLGLDPQRIVVGGVSAGGGLAAAVTLLSRDRRGPVPAGQMLLCPMLDDRNESASSLQMAGIGAWDRGANATAWRAYLAGIDPVPAYAAPARADDLSGLPPTFVDVGSAETFRDEDVDYARRIWAAGGDAELHVWPGGAHGFDALVPEAQLSRASLRARTDWLRRLLARLG